MFTSCGKEANGEIEGIQGEDIGEKDSQRREGIG